MDDAHPQLAVLRAADPEVAEAIQKENERQLTHLELIASENYCSRAVREAMASVLTDKYAEGYPGNRWYAGCEYMDVVESLAIERVCRLYGAEHANVQPHSGSQANMSAFLCLLEPGGKILSMSLAHGGHLTHGHRKSATGKLYEVISYGVRKDNFLIDYDQVRTLAAEQNPSLIIAGTSAYSREIDFAKFRDIADAVEASLMVDMAHVAGLVAAGLYCNPVDYADVITSTTHKTLRGPRSGFILCGQELASRIDAAVFPGVQGGPMMHVIAAKAVAFEEALRPEFKEYQKQIVANARAMAQEFVRLGLNVITGGTDTHLFLLDLTDRGITGRKAEEVLGKANITVNRNAVPFDSNNPAEAGGIRIGTPALTSRGMKEDQMRTIAGWVAQILSSSDPDETAAALSSEVVEMCKDFPRREFE